jgi:hypothetical protein
MVAKGDDIRLVRLQIDVQYHESDCLGKKLHEDTKLVAKLFKWLRMTEMLLRGLTFFLVAKE